MNVLWNVEHLKGSGQWVIVSRHESVTDAHVAFEAVPPSNTLAVRLVRDGGHGCCSEPHVVRERSMVLPA